jgi:hypothetical protein
MSDENNELIPNINIKKEFINYDFDKYEFYSFSFYLYSYCFFYLFIFEQTLIRAIFMNFLINIILNYSINHNIIYFITHKYWKHNLSDIAMPQLISCVSTVVTYNYNKYLMILLNIIIYYFIKQVYKKEIKYSRNLRIILLFLFFILKIIF